jgi:hypothetical protein
MSSEIGSIKKKRATVAKGGDKGARRAAGRYEVAVNERADRGGK